MGITIQHCFAKHLLLWLSYRNFHTVKALCFIGCYLINIMFFYARGISFPLEVKCVILICVGVLLGLTCCFCSQ
jgi:hypothetical protein